MGIRLSKNNKIVVLIVAVLGLILVLSRLVMKIAFSRKGYEILRDCDAKGCGYFGAPRGARKHRGVDLLIEPHNVIFAPFRLKVLKFGQVYSETTKFRYIEFRGFGLFSVFKMRVMYISNNEGLATGDIIAKDGYIGTVQDIAGYHGGGMQNHIHYEVRLLGQIINPTKFVKFQK